MPSLVPRGRIGTDSGTQPSRARARVPGQLALRRRHGLGDFLESGCRAARNLRAMARPGGNIAAALLQEALDDPVLKAVEGDDGDAAAGLQRALGGAQPLLQLLELGIQMDTDCLEGSRGGIAFHALAKAQGL